MQLQPMFQTRWFQDSAMEKPIRARNGSNYFSQKKCTLRKDKWFLFKAIKIYLLNVQTHTKEFAELSGTLNFQAKLYSINFLPDFLILRFLLRLIQSTINLVGKSEHVLKILSSGPKHPKILHFDFLYFLINLRSSQTRHMDIFFVLPLSPSTVNSA